MPECPLTNPGVQNDQPGFLKNRQHVRMPLITLHSLFVYTQQLYAIYGSIRGQIHNSFIADFDRYDFRRFGSESNIGNIVLGIIAEFHFIFPLFSKIARNDRDDDPVGFFLHCKNLYLLRMVMFPTKILVKQKIMHVYDGKCFNDSSVLSRNSHTRNGKASGLWISPRRT